jgi:hypothetical protein
MEEKCCSRCEKTKAFGLFIKNRNICKECDNSRKKFLAKNQVIKETEKCCSSCDETKEIKLFKSYSNICKDCKNEKRREYYNNNEEHRKKEAVLKLKKRSEKGKKREAEKQKRQLEIGEGNKQCRYCETIHPKDNFRHNRRKCKDCERWENKEGVYIKANFDNSPVNVQIRMRRLKDPAFKFICTQRARIYNVLKQNKSTNTIDYLGCNREQFFEWMKYQFNDKYTFENHGTEWHIDHVIPISLFNLNETKDQYLSLNWRNTMPLSVYENLSKSNKLIQSQIEQHYQTLLLYHKEKNIDFPQEFKDLYVQHDQIAGNHLRALTTTSLSETTEEGTRVMTETNGKNVKDWAIRSQAPNPAMIGNGEGSTT